jgi:hypothetical protein
MVWRPLLDEDLGDRHQDLTGGDRLQAKTPRPSAPGRSSIFGLDQVCARDGAMQASMVPRPFQGRMRRVS